MITSLHPDHSSKQPGMFIASLCLQGAVLAVLCNGSPFPQRFGPSIRSNAMSPASVTAIYFHKDTPATPSAPEPATSASRLASESPSKATEQDVNTHGVTQAETTDDSSGKGEVQGLAPFPSWRMNSTPSGFAAFHHQIKTALPVFTPDPPILHGEVPELARGKDVVLEVVIDDQGSIVQVDVLQAVGYGVEDSIMQTLRRWIFVPAKINGVAISSRRQLRFHFPG
jgi:TonB family protein